MRDYADRDDPPGGPPPTRHKEEDEELRSGFKVILSMILTIAVLSIVFYAFSQRPAKKDIGIKYGDCRVAEGTRGRWYFQCPTQGAFHAAIDDFMKQNPNYKLEGIVAQR